MDMKEKYSKAGRKIVVPMITLVLLLGSVGPAMAESDMVSLVSSTPSVEMTVGTGVGIVEGYTASVRDASFKDLKSTTGHTKQ